MLIHPANHSMFCYQFYFKLIIEIQYMKTKNWNIKILIWNYFIFIFNLSVHPSFLETKSGIFARVLKTHFFYQGKGMEDSLSCKYKIDLFRRHTLWNSIYNAQPNKLSAIAQLDRSSVYKAKAGMLQSETECVSNYEIPNPSLPGQSILECSESARPRRQRHSRPSRQPLRHNRQPVNANPGSRTACPA